MSANYDIGDSVRISVAFTDLTGAPTDPTTIVLTVQAPDGTQTAPAVVHDSTGSYHADYAPSQSGLHVYRWVGTGALVVAEEGDFSIRRRRVS